MATQQQEEFAERVALSYGRSRVEPQGGDRVRVVGMTDDIDRRAWWVEPDGERWEDGVVSEPTVVYERLANGEVAKVDAL